jgi:hypothetical protein
VGGVAARADAPRSGRPVPADAAYLQALETTLETRRRGWWNVDTVLNGHYGLGERRGEHAAAGDPRGVECPIDAMQMRE